MQTAELALAKRYARQTPSKRNVVRTDVQLLRKRKLLHSLGGPNQLDCIP
jgi:hypothetical protein